MAVRNYSRIDETKQMRVTAREKPLQVVQRLGEFIERIHASQGAAREEYIRHAEATQSAGARVRHVASVLGATYTGPELQLPIDGATCTMRTGDAKLHGIVVDVTGLEVEDLYELQEAIADIVLRRDALRAARGVA